ncbi:hypothetical protein ACFQRB_00915 [Halobaculum litoreum]|uniref:Uncharacterized protein n=1 Tax=Halobaculum litoreum TaxID=3031998 RepID=A0ABD5XKQ9_9EURY
MGGDRGDAVGRQRATVPGEARRQANMEDGKLNVVVVEDAPGYDYLARGALDKLLRRGPRTSPG